MANLVTSIIILSFLCCQNSTQVRAQTLEYDLINFLYQKNKALLKSKTFIQWDENGFSKYEDFNPVKKSYADPYVLNPNLDLDSLLTHQEQELLKGKVEEKKPTKIKFGKVTGKHPTYKSGQSAYGVYGRSFYHLSYPICINVDGNASYGMVLESKEGATYYMIFIKVGDTEWELIHKVTIAVS